jgi:hypothetical protein
LQRPAQDPLPPGSWNGFFDTRNDQEGVVGITRNPLVRLLVGKKRSHLLPQSKHGSLLEEDVRPRKRKPDYFRKNGCRN